jgi:hypothetical protein
LKDAAAVRDTAQRDGWLNDASTESIVAGLCRAALDGAIRQATINRAVRYGIVVDAALVALGEVRETGARVGHVLGLVGGNGRLPTTRLCAQQYLPAWNVGTHGGPAQGLDLKAQVRMARRACAELGRAPVVSDDVGLAGPVHRRIRVLLVRQLLEQQAAELLRAAEGPGSDRLHRRVARRLLLLTARVPEADWATAYGLAELAATVYGHTCAVLHGNRAFGDVPEVLVREWSGWPNGSEAPSPRCGPPPRRPAQRNREPDTGRDPCADPRPLLLGRATPRPGQAGLPPRWSLSSFMTVLGPSTSRRPLRASTSSELPPFFFASAESAFPSIG